MHQRVGLPKTRLSAWIVRHHRRTLLPRHLRGVPPILTSLALWEGIARAGVFPSVLFPSFSTVIAQFMQLIAGGDLLSNMAITTLRATAGFGLALTIGVSVGISMARIRLCSWFFEPLIAIGSSMPTVTLIPVFILWFGIGNTSKILLVALTCFFPIAQSTVAGAQQIDKNLIWSAQAMGTTKKGMLWRVTLPAALPFIFSGMRITLPVSFIVTFVAEMIGGGGGLGYALIYGYRFLETPTVFAVLLTVLTLGFFFDRALLYMRRFCLPWDDEISPEGAFE